MDENESIDSESKLDPKAAVTVVAGSARESILREAATPAPGSGTQTPASPAPRVVRFPSGDELHSYFDRDNGKRSAAKTVRFPADVDADEDAQMPVSSGGSVETDAVPVAGDAVGGCGDSGEGAAVAGEEQNKAAPSAQ